MWATIVGVPTGIVIERYDLFGRIRPPSIAEQLDQIRTEAALDGVFPVYATTADLHGSGNTSHIFVFRDAIVPTEYYAYPPLRSDEVRIYDEEDGRVKERLRFRPQTLRLDADEVLNRLGYFLPGPGADFVPPLHAPFIGQPFGSFEHGLPLLLRLDERRFSSRAKLRARLSLTLRGATIACA